MSADQQRIAAFVEYVIRPLSEDWRLIFEKAKELNLPITERLVKDVTFAVGLWHLTGEVLRAGTYIVIVALVCQLLREIWPLLPS